MTADGGPASSPLTHMHTHMDFGGGFDAELLYLLEGFDAELLYLLEGQPF